MQIIIPMAGQGVRFIQKGYKDIKPLIKIDGKPVIEYVIRMFPGETKFLFICNKEHLETTSLRKTLKSIAPKGKVVGIPPHNLGPAFSVIRAINFISEKDPVIVNYCDFHWVWDYKNFEKTVATNNCDGAIVCYKGFHPHLLGPNLYASCKVDEHNYLLEVREKYSFTRNKMDSYQSSGTYYFKSGNLLKKYCQLLIDKSLHVNNEYYASMIYSLMTEDKLKTYVYEISKFCQWGTPEDLEEFLYWSSYFRTLSV